MRYYLTALCLAIAVFCGATGTLESINLPKVEKVPWRFNEFPIIAFWGPPGWASPQDFANYRDAGFSL